MNKNKFILCAIATVISIASTFASKSHKNELFGAGTLFTDNKCNNIKHCVRTNQGLGVCTSATYYTRSGGVCRTTSQITPFVTN
jgi:hypothetical protein